MMICEFHQPCPRRQVPLMVSLSNHASQDLSSFDRLRMSGTGAGIRVTGNAGHVQSGKFV